MSQKLNKEELKKMLNISNDRTIRSYLKEKLLPFEYADGVDGEILFDRQQVLSILGIKQDPSEPLINSKEACRILKINDVKSMGAYLKRHNIPFYAFKNVKGTQRYFLQSELEASMKITANWNNNFPDLVARTHFLHSTMKFVFSSSLIRGLTPSEYELMDDIIFSGKSLMEMAEKSKVSRERIRQKFQLACKRVYFEVLRLKHRVENATIVDEDNERLKLENKMLYDKLKKSEEFDEAEHNSNLNAYLMKVIRFDLSVRCHHALKEMEVETLGQLTEMSRDDVKKHRNVGEKTVQEMERLLIQNGLTWKDNKPIEIVIERKSFEEEQIISIQNNIEEENRRLRAENNLLRKNQFEKNLKSVREEGLKKQSTRE